MGRTDRRERVALDQAYEFYKGTVGNGEIFTLHSLVNSLKTVTNALSASADGHLTLTTRLWLRIKQALFDKLITSFLQTETATSVNQLTMFIKAENLKTAMPFQDPAVSYWLQLKVVKAGGNNRIKTNLIWDIFTGGNRVSHSGGAIIEYNLYDTSGRSVASDTITEYTNYIKANKIKNLPDSSIDVVGCPCVANNSKPCQKETNQ